MERNGKQLLIASKHFAKEDRLRSWWALGSTLALTIASLLVAGTPLPLYICIPASLISGLLIVRLFTIFHDYMHGAILKDSPLAFVIMHAYGMLTLSPPDVWKHNHDEHHKSNSRDFGAEIGSFPVWTTQAYAEASWQRKLLYRFIRNPFTIVFGYFTSFWVKKIILEFLLDPRHNYRCLFSAAIHVGVGVLIAMYSWQSFLLAFLVPMLIGCALGTYLFFAQHNFPGVVRKEGKEWDHVWAALNSSSCMEMNSIMRWFTGNIGFHHVHHLNAKIPFYRLKEAMHGIKELQSPVSTSLRPVHVFACLRLKLWDPEKERLVSWAEAATSQPPAAAT